MLALIAIILAIFVYVISPKPFLFLRNDFKVFGIKDGDEFYVNDMVKSRSMTNMWRQISGAKSKKKLIRENDALISPNYKIINFEDKIMIEKNEKPIITVKSDKPVTVEVIWNGQSEIINAQA